MIEYIYESTAEGLIRYYAEKRRKFDEERKKKLAEAELIRFQEDKIAEISCARTRPFRKQVRFEFLIFFLIFL